MSYTSNASGLSFKNARALAIFIVVLCVSFVADRVLPLEQFGLRPRTLDGLTGIVAMPLLHADLAHLCANLVPLIVLMAMLIATQPKPLTTALLISVLSGVFTWLFARNGNHIGASGLVFGLATCLIARQPLTWIWALAPGLCLSVALEFAEIWDHYGAEVLAKTPSKDLAVILLRHSKDVLITNSAPFLTFLTAVVLAETPDK